MAQPFIFNTKGALNLEPQTRYIHPNQERSMAFPDAAFLEVVKQNEKDPHTSRFSLSSRTHLHLGRKRKEIAVDARELGHAMAGVLTGDISRQEEFVKKIEELVYVTVRNGERSVTFRDPALSYKLTVDLRERNGDRKCGLWKYRKETLVLCIAVTSLETWGCDEKGESERGLLWACGRVNRMRFLGVAVGWCVDLGGDGMRVCLGRVLRKGRQGKGQEEEALLG